MRKAKIAINGFGRIGRASLKIINNDFPQLEVVAINDLADSKTLAHLYGHDSCYGVMKEKISATESHISIDGKKIAMFAVKNPAELPWKELGVDIVLECTGHFRNKEALSLHLQAGAKKVVLSAPAKGSGVKTAVIGVNDDKLKKSDHLISCASCTTNCLAPVTKVIKDSFGIKKALMTTIHAYTANQNLIDGPHKDLRRARGAAVNMVPTTTGAAISTTETFPSLKGKFDGLAVRVPIPVGSICDTVFLLKKKTTLDSVIKSFKKAAKGKMKGVIEASEEELVSSDIVANPYSAIVDLKMMKLVDGDLLKVIAWYDNEWAYSARLVELVDKLRKIN